MKKSPHKIDPQILPLALALFRAVSIGNVSVTDRLIHIVSDEYESATLFSDFDKKEDAIKDALERYILFLNNKDVNCV